MKKALAMALSLVMMAMLVACGSGSSNNGGSGSYEGTLPDLINAIYEEQPIEVGVGEPMEVDLTNADSVLYYTGLSDASAVKEAYFSEPMMSSQAYSLVVLRLNDAADAEAVANEMFEGIDQVKWCCVTADSLVVAASGDLVLLAMVNSFDMGETLHTDLRDAFMTVVGADEPDISLERVDPDAMPKRR